MMFENLFGRNRGNEDEFKAWMNQMMKDYQKMFESLNKKKDDTDDKWEVRSWDIPNGFSLTSHTRSSGLNGMDDTEMENILNELSRMMAIPRHKTPFSGYSHREPIDKETRLGVLNMDLEESIENEDYEMAAKIRDEIKLVEEN